MVEWLTTIAFHENLYTVIARSEATKQSQQGSQTTPRDCFANARNDNFLMKRYTTRLLDHSTIYMALCLCVLVAELLQKINFVVFENADAYGSSGPD